MSRSNLIEKLPSYFLHILFFYFTSVFANTIHVPDEQPTIQAGINSALNGDTVLVADGRYYENINFRGRSITLGSHFILDKDTSHIHNTIIDGSRPAHLDTGSVVIFVSGEDTNAVLCGFTITGGTGTLNQYWGERTGGGIYIDSSSARIIFNRIVYNDLSYNRVYGAGMALNGSESDYLIIENNLIQDNVGSTMVVDTTSLYANGGGIAIYKANKIRIKNNRICDNQLNLGLSGGQVRGGGIYANAGVAVVTSNEICRNVCISESYPWMVGGGINLRGEYLVVSENDISGNTLTGFRTAGAGISMRTSDYLGFENNLVSRNIGTADWNGVGGGIHVYGDNYYNGNIFISGNRITSNEMTTLDDHLESKGGGIYVTSCSPHVSNNIIQGNVSNGIGGAMNITWWDYTLTPVSRPLLINNTIVENSAFQGNAIYLRHAQVDIVNSILWNRQADKLIDTEGECRVNMKHSIVRKGEYLNIGDGSMDLDPQFADSEWHLSEGSPAIGLGRTTVKIGDSVYHAPATDIDGHRRPAALDSLPDIGAYESPFPAVAHPVEAFHNNNEAYIHPFKDSIIIKVKMCNPHQQKVRLFVRLFTLDDIVWDYAELFDDGDHQDDLPGDNVFGAKLYPLTLERNFGMTFDVHYIETGNKITFSDNRRLTSIGPLIYYDHRIISQDSNRIYLQLFLQNEGKESPALEVQAELVSRETDQVRVVNNNQYFDYILPGHTAQSYRPYTIETDSDLDMLAFDVRISSNGYPYWHYTPLIMSVKKKNAPLPTSYILHQNYPNPFNPTTTIEFNLLRACMVKLTIFNILGEEVETLVSDKLTAGHYLYDWNATHLASGVYLYRLQAGDFIETRKMVFMR